MQTNIYVDGYNLYYGCLKHTPFKWLDLHALLFAQIVAVQDGASELHRIRYFTADVLAKFSRHGQHAHHAQQTYHRAIQTLYPQHIEVTKGYYQVVRGQFYAHQNPIDPQNRVTAWRLEEKETDVNLALQAYRDAAQNDCEQMVFVSNDSDLVPALRMIRADFPHKRIGLIFPIIKHHLDTARPPRPVNQNLRELAHWTRHHIWDVELAAAQLPDMIPTRRKPIVKPLHW